MSKFSGIVVTGSSGFLGRKIVDALRLQSYFVVGVDLVPSSHTDICLNLSNGPEVQRALTRYENFALIHAAAPLPGSLGRSKMLEFFKFSTDSLLRLNWSRRWLISSTAVLPIQISSLNTAEPWECYGQGKLWAEEAFLGEANSGDAIVLRLGTLVSEDSSSIFSSLVRRSLSQQLTLMPKSGELTHPISSPNGVARWIAANIPSDLPNIRETLVARQPMSIARYLRNNSARHLKWKLIHTPKSALKFLDSRPVFGISHWHLNALHYNMRPEAINELSDIPSAHLLGSYEEIFSSMVGAA